MAKFYKLQGAGNDYIFFDCFEREIEDPSKVSVLLSRRHFSVGSDGVILLERSKVGDAKMRIFNADGSEGKMCGNGVRCAARFLRDIKHIKKSEYAIETLAGVKRVFCAGERFTVKMGQPKILEGNFSACLNGERRRGCVVDVGNLHCVLLSKDVEREDVAGIGASLQGGELFPEGVNVEFLQDGVGFLKVRVYERGSGETYSCGTGACAAAAAAKYFGLCKGEGEVNLSFLGGVLGVLLKGEECYLSGEAKICYFGEAEINES